MAEEVAKIPNLDLNAYTFLLGSKFGTQEITASLLKGIETDEMAPFYEHVCQKLGWMVDDKLLGGLKSKNEAVLAEMESKIKDSLENLGETEYSDALTTKATYLARIGEKVLERLTQQVAVEAFDLAFEKTASLGHKIDILFAVIRIGFFHNDYHLITSYIEKVEGFTKN